jgi:hypothetical protein
MSRRFTWILALPFLVALGAAAPARASAYSMEILVDGRPLPELPHGPSTYVEALAGREYAVRLTNHTGRRVAVALAVDGLNSIDAKHTTAREGQKWILEPWQTVTLPGWQTGSGTARRFVFTTERRSYGAWLGKTADLGIVTAAFFRERMPQVPEPMINGGCDNRSDGVRERSSAKAEAAAPQAPEAKDKLAATGIGRQVDHRVQRVAFDEEDTPASIVTLRYEYRDALVRLGVIPNDIGEALARRERARGFTDTGFAPDPYRH